MIKAALKKTFQLILILMIAYAGSFVLMEEASEKTEKTEKAEEALHSIYHTKKFGKSISKGFEYEESLRSELHFSSNLVDSAYHTFSDFNIHFIYNTSYLDLVG